MAVLYYHIYYFTSLDTCISIFWAINILVEQKNKLAQSNINSKFAKLKTIKDEKHKNFNLGRLGKWEKRIE